MKTSLEGVLIINLGLYEDSRGRFVELYNKEAYVRAGIGVHFVEDDYSASRMNVLRGLHCDSKAWKLISYLHGIIYVVIANCNPSSKDFGKWDSYILAGRIPRQILVPPLYGIGHLAMSNVAIFHYKQSEYYDIRRQSIYRYDDPRFGIKWPTDNPILSERDTLGM